MWLYGSDSDTLETRHNGKLGAAGPAQGLGRYRAYGRFYERYWSKLFSVTQADMARIVNQLEAPGTAPTLTDLARDLIGMRLQHGPQLQSGPASAEAEMPALERVGLPTPKVAVWDPMAVWKPGDRVILVMPHAAGDLPQPCVGEITEVHHDCVVIQVDGISAPQVFPLNLDQTTERGMVTEAEVQALAAHPDDAAQVSFVLWTYGPYVVERLLQALEADQRFVTLEGRWSLHDTASRPTDETLAQLAMALFEAGRGPWTMSEIAMHMPGGRVGSFAQRLGLALALREHPHLFKNVGTLSHPRWELAGPPPAALTATCAVYDPDTYVVLCVPGEPISRTVSQRLWDLGLLRTATAPVTAHPPDAAFSSDSAASSVDEDDPIRVSLGTTSDTATRSQTTGPRSENDTTDARVWQRWLRFSRQ